jgi:hypothetical protein
MADIELVIKIDEEQYNMILLSDKTAISEFVSKEAMMYAIKNGIPLPKGHGRLIDGDAIDTRYSDPEVVEILDDVPTIIGADKEDKDRCKKCEYYTNPDYSRCKMCKSIEGR